MKYGGAEGDRTPDLKTASLARSQLRHSPNRNQFRSARKQKPGLGHFDQASKRPDGGILGESFDKINPNAIVRIKKVSVVT